MGITTDRNRFGVLCVAIWFAIWFAMAGAASAADGRIEINQARALAGGINGLPIFDPPGFPVQIYEGGSYVLTSDLIVSSGTETAIRILTTGIGGLFPDATDITIDLNGFKIQGPGTCTGEASSISCSGSGGFGIIASEAGLRTVVVRNGEISGFGTGLAVPVEQGGGCIVRDLIVTRNGVDGIATLSPGPFGTPRFPCLIYRNVVKQNGRYGILSTGPGLISDNVIHGNGSDGIRSLDPSAVHGNTIRDNGDRGIYLADHVLVANSAVEQSGGSGIEFSSFNTSLLIDNVLRGNGIDESPAAPQLDNGTCSAGYVHQVLTSGALGGSVDDGCSFSSAMDPNLCNGSPTCP